MVKAKVIQFRQGRKTQKPRHFLLEIEGCDTRNKARKFEGKEVVWTSPSKKEIKGKVSSAHGNSGVIRAIFEIGLPGQAIGTDAEIEGSVKVEKVKKTEADSEKKE